MDQMAEPENELPIRAHTTNGAEEAPLSLQPNYGHVGAPFYDVVSKQWTFKRNPTIHRPLKLLGQHDQHYAVADSNYWQGLEEPARRLKRQTNEFLKDFPEFISALELLPEHAQVSEAVTEVCNVYDSNLGGVLDFGSAVNRRGREPVQICAYPTGKAGECLLLTQVAGGISGWNFEEDVGLETHSVGGFSGYWGGDGTPILQVCFSGSFDQGEEYLAIRSPATIYIFCPMLYRSPPISLQPPKANSMSSSLQPNPILSIPLQKWDGRSFSHATFNPWYKKNIAVIDESGGWTVFEISGNRKTVRQAHAISVQSRGSLDVWQRAEGPETGSRTQMDGWHRILWICNSRTIAVCNRRDLALFELSSHPKLLGRPSLGVGKSPHWVLDIKQVPRERDYLFVVTSTKALLINAGTLGTVSNPMEPSSSSTILSWQHFRDKDDTSLSVSLSNDGENGIVAMIYSKLNTCITCLRFEIADQDGSAISLSDPTTIDISLQQTVTMNAPRRILSLKLSSLEYVSREHDQNTTLQHDFIDQGVSFLQVSILFDNHQLCLYTCYSSPLDSVSVKPFDWEKTGRLMKSEFETNEEMVDLNLGLDAVHQSTRDLEARTPLAAEDRSHWEDETNAEAANGSVNFEKVYNSIIGTDSLEKNSLAEMLDEIQAQLEGEGVSQAHTWRTIYELLKPLAPVTNVNDASALFDAFEQLDLRSDDHEAPNHGIRPLSQTINPSLDEDMHGGVSILSTYEHITKHWLGNLPHSVPRRLLLTKELVARQAAVEASLSSYRIRPVEVISQHEVDSTKQNAPELSQMDIKTPSVGSSFALPMRPPGKGKEQMSFASSQPLPSSAPSNSQPNTQLRTPEPTPSLASTSFSSAFLNAGGSLRLASLRQHTKVSKPPVILSGTMSRLLSHWTLGEDPSEYNFDTKTAELSQASDGKELSAKERKRIERKMKSRLRKERRENELLSAQSGPSKVALRHNLSQPLPPVIFGSSPGRSVAPSSQPGMASQIETGRFGARPKKKRKKTRMSGF